MKYWEKKKLTAQKRQDRISEGLRLSWAKRKGKCTVAYRPEWFAKLADGKTVLGMALDLHTMITGSSDPDYQAMAENYWLLMHVMENWQPTINRQWLPFDTAVLNLVIASTNEARDHALMNSDFKAVVERVARTIESDALAGI